MLQELSVNTKRRCELIDITAEVRRIIRSYSVEEGLCHIFVPHTTAAITVNEKADPDVVRDIEEVLARLVPESSSYRHTEGNSDAHVKSSILGASAFVPVSGGELLLGTWQGIFFCEFDGPRTRKVWVKIIPG